MKKLLAVLLALMMFVPVLSVAEEGAVIGGADDPISMYVTTALANAPTLMETALAAGRRIDTVMTVSALNGVQVGEPTIDKAIADLLDALALRFSSQGDEGDFAVMISGKDVLNFGGAVKGEDCYINSNLLGGTIVVSLSEIEPLLGRLMDMFVLMGAMTETDAAEIKAVLAETMAGLEQELAAGMAPAMMNADWDFSVLETVMTQLLGKITEVKNPVVPRMCDPAVAGVQLTLNNDDMHQLVEGLFQFLLDNPMLLDNLAVTVGLTADMVKEAMAEVDKQTMLDGEMVVAVYAGEDDGVVYATMNLPHHDNGVTTLIDAVYTRQTVAAGVAHLVNVTVDGRTATFDALDDGEKFTANLYAADGTKAMDLTILHTGEDAIEAAFNAYDDEMPVLSVQFAGECEFSDVREYYAGVLNIVLYENGQAMPLTFRLVSDYAVDGVDFTGVAGIAFEAFGVEIGLQLASQTSDPQESFLAGEVIRPAALEDAAFQTWFVKVINQVGVALTTLVTAMPESVLTLLMMYGM